MGAEHRQGSLHGIPETFREVTQGCASSVVIAGGEKMASDRGSSPDGPRRRCGGVRGVSIGRNVFQHRSPASMVRAIVSIVHGGATVREALGILKAKSS